MTSPYYTTNKAAIYRVKKIHSNQQGRPFYHIDLFTLTSGMKIQTKLTLTLTTNTVEMENIEAWPDWFKYIITWLQLKKIVLIVLASLLSTFWRSAAYVHQYRNSTAPASNLVQSVMIWMLYHNQGGLTSVYKTEIVQNLVHHEPQCLYTYFSAGVL